MSRWPAVFLLGLCLGLLVFADQRERVSTELAASERPAMPVASAAGSTGSTWYCAGGFVTPASVSDHVLVITNGGAQTAEGQVTVFPALPSVDGLSTRFPPEVSPSSVPARSQIRISLSALVPTYAPELASEGGAFAAALLEFDQPEVIVEHTVVTPQGTDTGPCASAAAPDWYFASGTTSAGVRDALFLFNPFADDAVVDVTFATDEGDRQPGLYNAMVVPARGLLVLDIAAQVTVRPQIATRVNARSGRLIAERVQVFNDPAGPIGASMALGISEPQLQWFFPAGRAMTGFAESYVVFNPNDTTAEVEFEAKLDGADRNGDTAPFPISVPPNQRVVVVVDESPTHPISDVATVKAGTRIEGAESYWVAVRGFNQVPVVVERVVTNPDPAGRGVTASPGAPRASTDQRVAVPLGMADTSSVLAIVNPVGDTISRVTVSTTVGDDLTPIAELEIAPRRRALLTLTDILPVGASGLRIESSTPVVSEIASMGPSGATSSLATPTIDTLVEPELFAFE